MALTLKRDGDETTLTDAELMGPDGDKETTYTIRHLTTEKHREVVREHTQKIPNKRTHQRDDVTDWEAVSDALLAYVLVKWSGVVVDGQAVPCEWAYTSLLDGPRKSALLERAGLNAIAATPERRAESFRTAADVR